MSTSPAPPARPMNPFAVLALAIVLPGSGQVFNRDQLLEQVWGGAQFIDASTVTVHVRRLREKVEPDPAAPQRIATVWGVGYRWDAHPPPGSPPPVGMP